MIFGQGVLLHVSGGSELGVPLLVQEVEVQLGVLKGYFNRIYLHHGPLYVNGVDTGGQRGQRVLGLGQVQLRLIHVRFRPDNVIRKIRENEEILQRILSVPEGNPSLYDFLLRQHHVQAGVGVLQVGDILLQGLNLDSSVVDLLAEGRQGFHAEGGDDLAGFHVVALLNADFLHHAATAELQSFASGKQQAAAYDNLVDQIPFGDGDYLLVFLKGVRVLLSYP